MTALVVCLAGHLPARAESPDLPPIEAPPDGVAPETGGFGRSAATQSTATAAQEAAAPTEAPGELIIQMPGDDPTPAQTTQQPPAVPDDAGEVPVSVPTRKATKTAPTENVGVPEDVPGDLLIPPPEPPGAATAQKSEEGAKAAPAPTTAAAPPAPVASAPVLPEPLALESSWKVRLLPFAAVGVAADLGFAAPTDVSLPSTMLFTAGATLAVTSGPILIEGRFSDSFYKERYLTKQLALSGGLAGLDVSEQKMNMDLAIGYEVLHHLDPKAVKFVTLTPFVGGGLRLFLSDNMPMNFAGPEAGGRLSVAPTSALVLSATYRFVPNLLSYEGPALLFGAPKFGHSVDVDVSIRLFGGAHARLSYMSEYLTLSSAYRAYQTVGIGFDYGF